MPSDVLNKEAARNSPRFGRRSVSPTNLVRVGQLRAGQALPRLVEPQVEGVLLWAWAERNRGFIEESLRGCGALLFRGFNVKTHAEFERCVRAVSGELLHYSERTTPRAQVSDWIYTSTEYPAHQSIAMHNELSYALRWPAKLWFYCARRPDEGGETPIVDVREVFRRISPRTRARFMRKGWMLVRNFGEGLGLRWQDSFNTDDPEEVERYCRGSEISFEWRDGGRLRTSQVRPAVIRHPTTKELSWFNHVAFYHVSSLSPEVRESLLSQFAESELPFNTYYGDGSPIEDSVGEEIREAYRRETVEFPWQEGDVLLLDNMAVGHGRNPFGGARQILVAMGDPVERRDATVPDGEG
jgi:alpha-ketoglutarate-dependent taurine dioxygenase